MLPNRFSWKCMEKHFSLITLFFISVYHHCEAKIVFRCGKHQKRQCDTNISKERSLSTTFWWPLNFVMCNAYKRHANEMTKTWLKLPKNLAWSLQPTNFLYRMSFALRWSQHHRSIANKDSEQFLVHVRISSCKVHQGWVEAWKWGYYIDHATHWWLLYWFS